MSLWKTCVMRATEILRDGRHTQTPKPLPIPGPTKPKPRPKPPKRGKPKPFNKTKPDNLS